MKTRQEIDENFKPEIIEARFVKNEARIGALEKACGLTEKTSEEVVAEAKVEAAAYPVRPPEPTYKSLKEAIAEADAKAAAEEAAILEASKESNEEPIDEGGEVEPNP